MPIKNGIIDSHIQRVTLIEGSSIGVSGSISPHYIEQRLCDQLVDGRIIPFIRVIGLNGSSVNVLGDYTEDYSAVYSVQGTVIDCSSLVDQTLGTLWTQVRVPALGLTLAGADLTWLYVDVITVADTVSPPTLNINAVGAVSLFATQRIVFHPVAPQLTLRGSYVFAAGANDVVIVRYAGV